MRWCLLLWVLRWGQCLHYKFLGISLGHPFFLVLVFRVYQVDKWGCPVFLCGWVVICWCRR